MGSPLSYRVNLEGYGECGWRCFETVFDWAKRGRALRGQLDADKLRYGKNKLLHSIATPATIEELLISAWIDSVRPCSVAGLNLSKFRIT